MTSDPVRAQFEAWAKENGYSLYRHNGAAYSSFLTQNVWAAWSAALAAQERGGERVAAARLALDPLAIEPAFRAYADEDISLGRAREVALNWAMGQQFTLPAPTSPGKTEIPDHD